LAPLLICAFFGYVAIYVISVILGNGDVRAACNALSDNYRGEGLCQAFVVFIRHGEKVPS
jgi:hypothetical protein